MENILMAGLRADSFASSSPQVVWPNEKSADSYYGCPDQAVLNCQLAPLLQDGEELYGENLFAIHRCV